MLTALVVLKLVLHAEAPAGLRCLPQWYAGSVVQASDGGWGLQLDGGTFLPWEIVVRPPLLMPLPDAGDPDDSDVAALADIYRPPYVTGTIVPVDVSDAGAIEDPGRARVEQLFLSTYGADKKEVQSHIGSVRFFYTRYGFHELAADPLRRVVEKLQAQLKEKPKLLPFLQNIGGTFMWRRIKGSKNLSTHAFGIAIDINVERSSYWRWTFKGQKMVWKNRVPQEVVDAFESEGFIWGGRWAHYDTMHFEYRPELTHPSCREGG